MRSRKKQCTVNCHEVHDRVGAVVQQHVQLEDYGYKCRASVLLNVLFFAVSRISSIFAACRNLAHAPTQQAVFNALVATLPEYDELEKRLNAALVDGVPKALRRPGQTLAIDLTLIPYHGQPYRHPWEIYRSQPKSGTSHFHAYATCYVVRKGHRFTVALTPLSIRRRERPPTGCGCCWASTSTAARAAAKCSSRSRRRRGSHPHRHRSTSRWPRTPRSADRPPATPPNQQHRHDAV